MGGGRNLVCPRGVSPHALTLGQHLNRGQPSLPDGRSDEGHPHGRFRTHLAVDPDQNATALMSGAHAGPGHRHRAVSACRDRARGGSSCGPTEGGELTSLQDDQLSRGRLIQQGIDSSPGVDPKLHSRVGVKQRSQGVGRIAQLAPSLTLTSHQRYRRLPFGERGQRFAAMDESNGRVPQTSLVRREDQSLAAARQGSVHPDHHAPGTGCRGAVRLHHVRHSSRSTVGTHPSDGRKA